MCSFLVERQTLAGEIEMQKHFYTCLSLDPNSEEGKSSLIARGLAKAMTARRTLMNTKGFLKASLVASLK